jgi:hypothetical protein
MNEPFSSAGFFPLVIMAENGTPKMPDNGGHRIITTQRIFTIT